MRAESAMSPSPLLLAFLAVAFLTPSLTPSLAAAQDLSPFASIRTYSLSLPPHVWTLLQATAGYEEYVPAQLSIDADLFGEDVGLRFKGSIGTLASCSPTGAWDRTLCARLSMKIKFTEYEGKAWRGAKTLNFHAMARDPTFMHEKIAYGLFTAVGVHAPSSHWAKIVVNGEDLGLFSLVQQIDDNFIENRLGDDSGQLYKSTWLDTSSVEVFEDGLKEGKSNHSSILALQTALNAAVPGTRLSTLGAYFDTTALFNYMAVDTALNNWDGVTGFYCGSTGGVEGCGNSNFYIHRNRKNKFILIPWDMDQTVSTSFNIFGAVPAWNQAADCSVTYNVDFGEVGRAPSCSAFFQALAEDGGAFNAALDRLFNGAWTNIESDIEVWRTALWGYIPENERFAWNAAVNNLKADIPALKRRALTFKK